MKTKAQEKLAEREKLIQDLREDLKPGMTIYTLLASRSASGMSKKIRLYYIENNRLWGLTHKAAKVLDRKMDDGCIIVKGAGFDAGYDLVYGLAHALYPQEDRQKELDLFRHEWIG